MAILTSCATIGSVIVATRHCAEVTWLNHLIHICFSLLSCHLVDLCHLSQLGFLFLIDFFIFLDGFVGQSDQHLRSLTLNRLVLGLLEEVADVFFLLYKI